MIIALQLGDVKCSHDLFRSNSSGCLEHQFPVFLAPGTGFIEDSFSTDQSWGMALGWFECITFTAHIISIIITSTPLQIIRYWIPEVGNPWSREQRLPSVFLLPVSLSWVKSLISLPGEVIHPNFLYLNLNCFKVIKIYLLTRVYISEF